MSLNYKIRHNIDIRNFILKARAYAKYLSTQNLTKRGCPVCGSGDYSFYASNDYLDYYRCNNCTHLFMNPTLDPRKITEGVEGDDELMTEYFTIMSRYKSDVPPKPDPLTDNKLVDIYKIKPSGRLLDIGCAFGDFLHKAKHFYEVEGVEVNPQTAGIAAREFTIHKKYLHELRLGKNYDIVTLHQVLYGVPDPISLFREIHNILRDDGILYVNTPNADSYAMQLYKGKANHLYGYTTQNVFNRKSLEKLAENSGFKTIMFRTEWLDIYITDLLLYLDSPSEFIHKKNPQLVNYEHNIMMEDELHKKLSMQLGERGNYLVAVLEKA